MKKLPRTLHALIFITAPLLASGEPVVHTQQVYYDLGALTTSDLYNQVRRYGPRDKENRPALGLTRWKVNWHFTLVRSLAGCSLAHVDTTANIIVTLPRLSPQARYHMPDHTRMQLENFFAQVQQHERVHQSNGTQAAYESDRRLHELPAYPDCEDLEANIKNITDSVVEKYSQLDNYFDAQSHQEGELPLLTP